MLFISIANMSILLLLLLLIYTSEGSLNNVIVRNFVYRYFQIQPDPRKVYKLIIKKSKERRCYLKKKKKKSASKFIPILGNIQKEGKRNNFETFIFNNR